MLTICASRINRTRILIPQLAVDTHTIKMVSDILIPFVFWYYIAICITNTTSSWQCSNICSMVTHIPVVFLGLTMCTTWIQWDHKDTTFTPSHLLKLPHKYMIQYHRCTCGNKFSCGISDINNMYHRNTTASQEYNSYQLTYHTSIWCDNMYSCGISDVPQEYNRTTRIPQPPGDITTQVYLVPQAYLW